MIVAIMNKLINKTIQGMFGMQEFFFVNRECCMALGMCQTRWEGQ